MSGLTVRLKRGQSLCISCGEAKGQIRYFERNGSEIALQIIASPEIKIDRPKWLDRQKKKQEPE